MRARESLQQMVEFWLIIQVHRRHLADWLLMVDSDTLVANLTKPLDPFLDGPEHVLLHWRPNREVTAAAVAVRTSEFGRCFLNRWLGIILTQKHHGREVNWDNGALLLLIAEFVDPGTAQKCAGSRLSPFDLITCYEASNRYFRDIPSPHVPIRVFPLLGGFWRQHEGVDQQEPEFGHCYNQSSVETMMFKRHAPIILSPVFVCLYLVVDGQLRSR